MIDPASRPAVSPMLRLQFDRVQEAWVLRVCEGVVTLNTPAAEILRRCDGRRSVDEIVGELELAFARGALREDVHAFLAQARERGWLR